MLGLLRPNTYKAALPRLTRDFFEFRVLEDEVAADLLVKHIWTLIKRAKHKLHQMPGCEGGTGGVSVALPVDFLNRLARDIVRMAEGEPNGIRGCVLKIEYRDGNESIHVGKIKMDPHISGTTFLTLRIFKDNKKHESKSLILRLFGSLSSYNVIYISPGYMLEKTKRARKIEEKENS